MRLKLAAAALFLTVSAIPHAAPAQTPCPVDFSGSGLTDEQVYLFCAEFESNMGGGGGQTYTYYELVNYYTWASLLNDDFDSSYPDENPP